MKKGYRRGHVAIGLILITISFVFVFSYVGFIVNKEYTNISGNPINVTGLDSSKSHQLVNFWNISLYRDKSTGKRSFVVLPTNLDIIIIIRN